MLSACGLLSAITPSCRSMYAAHASTRISDGLVAKRRRPSSSAASSAPVNEGIIEPSHLSSNWQRALRAFNRIFRNMYRLVRKISWHRPAPDYRRLVKCKRLVASSCQKLALYLINGAGGNLWPGEVAKRSGAVRVHGRRKYNARSRLAWRRRDNEIVALHCGKKKVW